MANHHTQLSSLLLAVLLTTPGELSIQSSSHVLYRAEMGVGCDVRARHPGSQVPGTHDPLFVRMWVQVTTAFLLMFPYCETSKNRRYVKRIILVLCEAT